MWTVPAALHHFRFTKFISASVIFIELHVKYIRLKLSVCCSIKARKGTVMKIQGVNEIKAELRKWGIELVYVGYIERTLFGNTEYASSVCMLVSVQCQKEMVVQWGGLRGKITGLLQDRWQDSRTECSSWKPCFHKKTVRRELHNCKIYGTPAIAKLLIPESNIQMRKRRCHDHKTWTSDNRKTLA
jgi:hypothetical protein